MAQAEDATGAYSGDTEPFVWGARRGDKTQDGQVGWENAGDGLGGRATRPMFYYMDGSPILDDELLPANIKWALLVEEDRSLGDVRTLYGERLSTVWLGLDHQFGNGKPLIFETMLFAPKSQEQRNRERKMLRRYAAACKRSAETGEELQLDEDEQTKQYEAWVKKSYPHDELQLRYSTRFEAEDAHEKLKLQCLIPPRWRHFLLWTIGRDRTWAHHYDDYEEDEWS